MRLAFALKYQHWTVENWKRVIWSDENKINRIGSDGQEYVWKRKGEGLISREVKGTVKFGGGSLMVWGCIGWNGVGVLSEVEGKMDAEQYVAIWRKDCCRAWRILGSLKVKSSFSKIMTPSIHPEGPRFGLRSKVSSFFTGLLSLQTSVPLNILGITSKGAFQVLRGLLQEFINYWIGWW